MSEGFIPYLERTRSYYSALGYPAYEWAHHETIPFTSPDKRLADATVVLITTAALNRAVESGALGALADDLIGLPTNRSQRRTSDMDALDVLALCRELGADLALLVPT